MLAPNKKPKNVDKSNDERENNVDDSKKKLPKS